MGADARLGCRTRARPSGEREPWIPTYDRGMGARSKKSWADFSPTQQRLIVGVGAAEAVFTAAALLDLKRRPAAQVRGPKLLWVLASFVQPIGPILYAVAGRR